MPDNSGFVIERSPDERVGEFPRCARLRQRASYARRCQESCLHAVDRSRSASGSRRSTGCVTRAFALGQRAVVRAFGGDVPLSPANGGRSIGEDALEIGDIILATTRDDPVSIGIRVASHAPVSHAMLYIGGGQVVEAVGGGVMLH